MQEGIIMGIKETEKDIRRIQSANSLTYWTRVLFTLTIFFSICYVIYNVANEVGLHPEILTNPSQLTIFVGALLAIVAHGYMYLFGICIVLWLILGLLNIFL